MAYRNKTYVCFDGDNDIHYYRLMQAWHQNDRSTFSFYDAHDLNNARDTSQEISIKYRLKQRLAITREFIVLAGSQTRYLYKFVRWEIEQAIQLDLPIIVVNINGLRQQDISHCPPLLQNALAVHISYNPAILQYALENWPSIYTEYKRKGITGPHYYNATVYQNLGL